MSNSLHKCFQQNIKEQKIIINDEIVAQAWIIYACGWTDSSKEKNEFGRRWNIHLEYNPEHNTLEWVEYFANIYTLGWNDFLDKDVFLQKK